MSVKLFPLILNNCKPKKIDYKVVALDTFDLKIIKYLWSPECQEPNQRNLFSISRLDLWATDHS